ncbi:hypothetical protein ES703_95273 [subsurface metagenome]
MRGEDAVIELIIDVAYLYYLDPQALGLPVILKFYDGIIGIILIVEIIVGDNDIVCPII